MPYTALSRAARTKALASDEDMIISNGCLVARGLDRSGEANISILEWIDAAAIAVKRIRFHHGEVRGDALETHHRTVLGLATSVSWQVAVVYDIQQRGAMANNVLHDVAPLDEKALAVASARVVAVAHQQAATSYSSAAQQSSPNKRAAPGSQSQFDRQPKRTFSSSASSGTSSPTGGLPRCFRCGATGHLPKECSASITRAGQTPATLSVDLRSPNGLCAPSGNTFCYCFASGSCQRGDACNFIHSCSICNKGHGARACPSAT